MWKPKRDVYVSWNTGGGWLSVGVKEGRARKRKRKRGCGREERAGEEAK